jgi:hypothetical protein
VSLLPLDSAPKPTLALVIMLILWRKVS